MTTAPAASVDVDSSDAEQHADQGTTRRRVETPRMGAGERKRSVDVQIGEYEYTARCPKLVVWQDMAQIIEAQQSRSRSDRRRAGDRQPAAEGRVTTDRVKLTAAMTHFLRGCLSSADWAAIEADLSDPDDDLDIPDLWAAGVQLVVEFKPDMKTMADSIGMKVPAVLDKLAERIGPDGQLVDEPDEPDEPAQTQQRGGSRPRKTAARKAR